MKIVPIIPALNPDKTDEYKYVSSYACSPETVDAEFMLSKQEYFNLTGRVNKNDIIAYQLRQSFKPGEVTPEEANKISYELASRLLKGQYAFIVATHVDKKHIHSHINNTYLNFYLYIKLYQVNQLHLNPSHLHNFDNSQ